MTPSVTQPCLSFDDCAIARAPAARGGRREQATRALAACTGLAGEMSAAPLLDLARALARRARLVAAPAASSPASSPAGHEIAGARLDLTGRESEILLLLTEGRSNRQIARTLFISERTVAVHVSRIFDKLGVHNRTEAAIVGATLKAPAARPLPNVVATDTAEESDEHNQNRR